MGWMVLEGGGEAWSHGQEGEDPLAIKNLRRKDRRELRGNDALGARVRTADGIGESRHLTDMVNLWCAEWI